MNIELLQELGLNNAQAKVYIALIEKGELTPPEVAEITGESRTNAYMVMERLEELGLVEQIEVSKKIHYRAQNPTALETIVDHRRTALTEVEQKVKGNMPALLSYFYGFTEKPGVRLLQGVDGLKEIYADTLRTKSDIHFLRAAGSSEIQTLGVDYYDRYKKKRAELGICTYSYTTDIDESRKYSADDGTNLITRRWIDLRLYNAPMEMNVYADKVAYLAFGEEVMGIIIQSPIVAEGMRQILKMASGYTSEDEIVPSGQSVQPV